MRIIRGKYGRRRFDVPTNITARPTTDFARENLFNVLENIVDFGIHTADSASDDGFENSRADAVSLTVKLDFSGQCVFVGPCVQ